MKSLTIYDDAGTIQRVRRGSPRGIDLARRKAIAQGLNVLEGEPPAPEGFMVKDGVFAPVEKSDQDVLDEISEEVRSVRNQKLAGCDWTQMPDAPVDQKAWATYRAALRDITKQSGFPRNVKWPEPPPTARRSTRPLKLSTPRLRHSNPDP